MAKRNSNDSTTFVKISNKDIYNEIKAINGTLQDINKGMVKSEELFKSNDKQMGLLRKSILGAYGLTITVLGWLIAHITKS